MSTEGRVGEELVRLAVTSVLDPGRANEDGTISIVVAVGERCFELLFAPQDADAVAVAVIAAEWEPECERRRRSTDPASNYWR